MDLKKWLSETAHSRVTDADIAKLLGVTRKTANRRINDGLNASDLIAVCRALAVNPVDALVELEYLDDKEVMAYMDSDGRVIDNASDSELSLELARRLNPATLADVFADLAHTAEHIDTLSEQDLTRGLLLLQQELARRTDLPGPSHTDELAVRRATRTDAPSPDDTSGYDPARHVAYHGPDEDQLSGWNDDDDHIP